MVSRQNTQTLVTRAFPGREPLIERDYRKCASALERWRRSGGVPSPRVDEYTELLDELTEEIEAWLDAVAVCSTRPCEAGGE